MATQLAGMDVPKEIVARMEKTPKAAQPEEGIRICCEIIEQVRQIPGIAGLHLMAVRWAESIPEIVKRSKLYPR
jgi:methylenetetrahydrofolate reductase (NADPH)